VIEIGCVELFNRIPTGREFHRYVNPERDVPAEAQAVHGITTEFLLDKPLFAAVADELAAFLGDDLLVIHNAAFDVAFLNAEFARLGLREIAAGRVVDTLQLARRKHPAGPNSLDALCKRYGVDNSQRAKHGALKDSVLLAAVYVELLGEKQAALELATSAVEASAKLAGGEGRRALARSRPLAARLTPAIEAAHRAFVTTLGPKAIWLKYFGEAEKRAS
jgi:DNA polymerase-3 subunit epsilon